MEKLNTKLKKNNIINIQKTILFLLNLNYIIIFLLNNYLILNNNL